MKRNLLFPVALLISCSVMAGGIVTNTNQSAMFTRLQARDATIGIDAVYYNPAALSFLPKNGLFLSLNNQTLGQTRTITSDYEYLNGSEYIGDVSAMFFPGIYAAYKMNKLTFSAGFNPIGGGGGGTYDTGLPSFEYPVADLVPALMSYGQDVRDYSLDAYFEGSSVYFGYQANISYKINDMLSVAVGGRYVSAKESYIGHLRDVMLNVGGTWVPAPTVFTNLAAAATSGASLASGAATAMQPLIDGGAGTLTFAQAEGLSVIDATTRAQLEGGLLSLGYTQTAIDAMTLAEAQLTYQGQAAGLTESAATATATASLLQDQDVEYDKTASGFTPIISVDLHISDMLNIAVKYEHKTTLEFTNDTKQDFTTGFDPETGTPITMFPDGEKSRYDMPSQLVVGATLKPIDRLLLSTGVHYYMDQQADWDGREDELDGNAIEVALGGEFQVTEKLALSAGYLFTKSGATEAYQTDLSYSLPSSSVGGGLAFTINPMIELNLAGSYTMYQGGEKNFEHDLGGTGLMIPTMETYDKDVWIVAVGLNISLAGGK
jgi:long-chain fatty acid transport protein